MWAEIIDGVEAKDLHPLIEKKVKKGTIICSDTWRTYTGIATKGYLHRLVNHGKGEYSDRRGNHINGLEGFFRLFKKTSFFKGRYKKREKAALSIRVCLEI